MLRRIAIVAFVALAVTVSGPSEAGAEPIVCPPGSEPDPRGGICIITVMDAGGGGAGGGGDGGGSSQQAPQRTCTFTLGDKPKDVPCSSDDGWWSQSQQAY